MNGLGHQIFSGSAFAQDQHCGIPPRYQLGHVVNAVHRRRVTNHSGQRAYSFTQLFVADDVRRTCDHGIISQ